MSRVTLPRHAMHACEPRNIERPFCRIQAVTEIDANPATKKATITFDPETVSLHAVRARRGGMAMAASQQVPGMPRASTREKRRHQPGGPSLKRPGAASCGPRN